MYLGRLGRLHRYWSHEYQVSSSTADHPQPLFHLNIETQAANTIIKLFYYKLNDMKIPEIDWVINYTKALILIWKAAYKLEPLIYLKVGFLTKILITYDMKDKKDIQLQNPYHHVCNIIDIIYYINWFYSAKN